MRSGSTEETIIPRIAKSAGSVSLKLGDTVQPIRELKNLRTGENQSEVEEVSGPNVDESTRWRKGSSGNSRGGLFTNVCFLKRRLCRMRPFCLVEPRSQV
jgi:hypothetical protein